MSYRQSLVKKLEKNAVEQALVGLHEAFVEKTAEAIAVAKKEAQMEDIAEYGIFIAMSRRQDGKQI